MVVIPRPSECCYLTHIKQIMKHEKNLFAWMACKCMPIFSIKLYKYLQYILIANPHITTFFQLFTILTELQLIIARTSPENLHKREENRYMSCDQQHILKEMIHLYLEEWHFSERGQKVMNRFKTHQITRDYTQNQNKWDFCYVIWLWTKRPEESKAAN